MTPDASSRSTGRAGTGSVPGAQGGSEPNRPMALRAETRQRTHFWATSNMVWSGHTMKIA